MKKAKIVTFGIHSLELASTLLQENMWYYRITLTRTLKSICKMLNNTEHHCFVFLSERLILLVFHQRDMWSLTFPSFVGWQSHPFYLGFLKKAGSSHLALTFVTIDQLQLNITRDWDTNNIYVLQLNDYKRCPNQLRKSPYGESSMGARQQKACAGKVSHLKSHCSPRCLFSTFDTTTTQIMPWPLFSLNVKSCSFSTQITLYLCCWYSH